jgi:hypothetical protein
MQGRRAPELLGAQQRGDRQVAPSVQLPVHLPPPLRVSARVRISCSPLQVHPNTTQHYGDAISCFVLLKNHSKQTTNITCTPVHT